MSDHAVASSRPARFAQGPVDFVAPVVAGIAVAGLVLLSASNLLLQLPSAPVTAHLLPWAREMVPPNDHDAAIYHIGLLSAVSAGLLGAWLHGRVLRAPPSGWRVLYRVSLAVAPALLCLWVSPITYNGVDWTPLRRTPPAALFATAVVLMIGTAGLCRRSVRQPPVATPRPLPPEPTVADASAVLAPWVRVLLHLAVASGLFVLLYVPDVPALVGSFWRNEGFHHWHFFAILPTLGYLTGRLPVLEAYSQYGFGIPVVFGTWCRLLGDFSYGRVLGLGIAYGVVYFIALYALLWTWLRSWPWSVAGVAGALLLQQFSGLAPGEVLWQYPSSTVLRSPVDVWLFLVLAWHVRHRRGVALVFASLLVGIALFWETDTGVYLFAGYAAYGGCWCVDERLARGWDWGPVVRWLAVLAIVPATWLGLLYSLVGKGLLTPLFWQRYFEPMQLFSAGFGMLPMPPLSIGTLHAFLTPAVYVLVLVLALAAALQLTIHTWREGYLLAAVGIYGLGTYHQYIGRSHPWNWFHVCIPLVIAGTVLSHLLFCGLQEQLRRRAAQCRLWRAPFLAVQLAPIVIMLRCIELLASAPSVHAYPGIASGRWSIPETDWNVSGAGFKTTPVDAWQRNRVAAVAARIQQLVPADEPVAVLSPLDGFIYVLAHRRPFSRFAPLYPAVALDSQRDEVLAALAAPHLRYVVRDAYPLGVEASAHYLPSVLEPYLKRQFERVEDVKGFELWRRRD